MDLRSVTAWEFWSCQMRQDKAVSCISLCTVTSLHWHEQRQNKSTIPRMELTVAIVANRISTILEHSQSLQSIYDNTTLNPAYHVLRGQTVEAFLKKFLALRSRPVAQRSRSCNSGWRLLILINNPEVKRVAQMHVTQEQEPKDTIDQWMIHYSSWTKLKRFAHHKACAETH